MQHYSFSNARILLAAFAPALSQATYSYLILFLTEMYCAGPYFDDEFIDFYNLELINTNTNDHDTYNFAKNDNWKLEIARPNGLV